ncbi:sulfate anion transporter [Athelia psychrophila]|uniref:Sulfate anion transporter n=1 Tax=Athelia psychrophila TaxID=1759441 RepID=A0A165XVK7_9AGAM|nr:sulfate anion transporter [Fibularhizoctonia sp. CBS 109695]
MFSQPTTNLESNDASDATRPSLTAVTSATSFQALISAPHTPPSPGGLRNLDERSSFLGHDVDERRYGSAAGSERGSLAAPVSRPPVRGRPTWRVQMKYYIPSIEWIPNYSFALFGGDLLAGFTVASMLIPQSVSYASSLAKLSPVTGLFSASIPGIIYAFLGSSRQLNVAPEAALSLLVGQAVSDILHHSGTPDKHSEAAALGIATAITVQTGLISFVLGILRLGFIDVVLSRAMLQGFIAAVAVIIMIEQLIPMLGLVALEKALNPHTTGEKFMFLVENMWTHSHHTTAIVSFGALLALVCLRIIKRFSKRWSFIYRLPEVLVVVIISTILSDELRWDEDGVAILGAVPINTGSSFIQLPFRHANIKYMHKTTSTAVLISVIGFLDSIVAAKQNSSRFGYSISPNRELVALGAGNLVGSFIPGTLPAYGSITRSRMNADVGARTQMASLVCSALVLLATFFLLPWLFYLPKGVLASVIFLVALSLFAEAPHDIAYYWKMQSWTDLALMIITFACSMIWNVEVGIVVAIIISLLLVVRRSSKPRMAILGRVPGTDKWKPVNENEDAPEEVPGAMIIRIRENLDFANTAQLKERLRRFELYGDALSHPSEAPRRAQTSVLVFHMADMDSCDASAVQIFQELFTMYQARGVKIFVTHLRSGPLKYFQKAGIMELLGPEAFYDNLADAMAKVESR